MDLGQAALDTKKYIRQVALCTKRYLGQVALFPSGMQIMASSGDSLTERIPKVPLRNGLPMAMFSKLFSGDLGQPEPSSSGGQQSQQQQQQLPKVSPGGSTKRAKRTKQT